MALCFIINSNIIRFGLCNNISTMNSLYRNLICDLPLSRLFRRHCSTQKNLVYSNNVRLGNVSPERHVPDYIIKPDYYYRLMEPGDTTGTIEIKNQEQIAKMRSSCNLAANILKSCEAIAQAGIQTDKIDAFVHESIIAAKAYPSPLRYAGYPKSVCTSVNNVACHGIPDDRPLADGDIINIDITVYLNGYHGDCSRMFLIGDVNERGKFLVHSTEECLQGCIRLCGPNVKFNAIGNYISNFCKQRRLNTITAFIGHGIGSYFHGPPEILHYANDVPGAMQPGMTFTIEPILTLGGPEIEIQEDGWTAMTIDGSPTAQFEHTLLITETGVEILTVPD